MRSGRLENELRAVRQGLRLDAESTERVVAPTAASRNRSITRSKSGQPVEDVDCGLMLPKIKIGGGSEQSNGNGRQGMKLRSSLSETAVSLYGGSVMRPAAQAPSTSKMHTRANARSGVQTSFHKTGLVIDDSIVPHSRVLNDVLQYREAVEEQRQVTGGLVDVIRHGRRGDKGNRGRLGGDGRYSPRRVAKNAGRAEIKALKKLEKLEGAEKRGKGVPHVESSEEERHKTREVAFQFIGGDMQTFQKAEAARAALRIQGLLT